jgi:5-enolpyruvylshikimate-3-phosphate synthase
MRNLGATVEAFADGFAFESNIGLVGTEIEPFGDHHIAMAFGIAGLVLPGMRIRQAEHAAVSFPGFWRAIGAAT